MKKLVVLAALLYFNFIISNDCYRTVTVNNNTNSDLSVSVLVNQAQVIQSVYTAQNAQYNTDPNVQFLTVDGENPIAIFTSNLSYCPLLKDQVIPANGQQVFSIPKKEYAINAAINDKFIQQNYTTYAFNEPVKISLQSAKILGHKMVPSPRLGRRHPFMRSGAPGSSGFIPAPGPRMLKLPITPPAVEVDLTCDDEIITCSLHGATVQCSTSSSATSSSLSEELVQ